MNRETAKQQLEAALRQYKHNDSSGGLVFAYELSRTEVLVESLLREIEQERTEKLPSERAITIGEAMDLIQHGAESINAAYKKLRDET